MNPHPYLRAYLAGVFVPTLVLALDSCHLHHCCALCLGVPFPIERFIIFPMSVVPRSSASGTCFTSARMRAPICPRSSWRHPAFPWASHRRFQLPIVLACWQFGAERRHLVSGPVNFPTRSSPCGFLAGVAFYYLVWKYIVGFLNRVLGIT